MRFLAPYESEPNAFPGAIEPNIAMQGVAAGARIHISSGDERFRALLPMGVTLVPASGLGERAFPLALELGTVYDSLYLREAEGCDFVTADERR